MNSDSGTTEWSEAIAVSDQRNKEAFLADLEARYVALESERDQLHERALRESERAAALEKRAVDLQHALSNAEMDLTKIGRDSQTDKDKALTAESQQKMLQERLTRLEEEGDSLREEISRLTKNNKNLSDNLVEAETKAKLNDSAAIPLQYEVERVQKELDALCTHTAWLEQELSSRNDALVALKLEHSSELIKIREASDQAIADRDQSEVRVSQLERSNQEYMRRAEKLASELRNCGLEAAAANETAERELIAERRLVEMQKEQLDRSENRFVRLEKELETIRSFASKYSDETQKEVDEMRLQIEADARRILNEQSDAHEKEVRALKNQLKDALRDRDKAEDGLLGSPSMSRWLTAGGEDEPISLTDLYMKLNVMEDDLNAERTKRKKAELLYQRVHADISAKTPLLNRQRQEHEWAMEQREEAQARLHEAIQELAAVRRDAEESGLSKSRLEMERNTLKLQTKELAKQVQALLTSKSGGTVPEGIPVSVQEIQTQNLQLIGEHARLTLKIEHLEEKLRNDKTTVLLEQTEKEVETLRENRTRQEILVAGIVQQRDLYRALLAKHGDTIGGLDATQLVVAQHSEETKAIRARNLALEQDLAKAQAAVMLMQNDRDSLSARISRYDAHTMELTASIDKLQNELTSSHSSAARNHAEAGYFRDRCVRIEESLQHTRDEVKCIQDGKKELQNLCSRLQQSLASANAEVAKYESQAREAERNARLAETQTQVSKESEFRLSMELNQVRTQLHRQGNLVESVRKIEASLSAKNDEEKESSKDSYDRLSQMMNIERSKHAVEIENLKNQIKDFEMNIKVVEAKKDEALAETIASKKEALALSNKVHSLSIKCDTLEAQLSATRKKLGEGTVDDAEVSLAARFESVMHELDQTKADLEAAKSRVSEYQKIAKSSESALRDLTKTSEDFKNGSLADVEELRRRIEEIKKDSQAKQDIIVELTDDLCRLRSEQQSETDKLNTRIVGLTDEVQNAKKDAEFAVSRADSLLAEMEKYRLDGIRAQNNYERELSLHATARTDLRKACESLSMEQSQRRKAEESFEALRIEVAEKEKSIEEEKEVIRASSTEAEKLLKESRDQNEALHKQLATIVDQVEKGQAARIEAAAAVDGPAIGSEEAVALQKVVSELREVVRYIRSENAMIQAQLDAARRTAERERAATVVVKRSLDEARAEIKMLQEKDTVGIDGGIGGDQAEKLKNLEMQSTLLRESNQLLRAETLKLEASLKTSQFELDETKAKLEPLEKSQRDSEVEKLALEAEKDSLKRDLETWKGRLQSMVSKFNTIDPDEHKKVLGQVDQLKKETSTLKAQVLSAEKETIGAKAALAKLNKELSQQKSLLEKQTGMLAKMKTDKDAATKSSSASLEVAKERDQLKEKIQKMEFEALSTKTELDGANQRLEMLKKRMRQFQETLNKQTAKIEELEKALAAATSNTVPEPESMQVVPKATTPQAKLHGTDKPAGKEQDQAPIHEVMKETKAAVPSQGVMKDELPCVPEGGFKFGPGGKRPLLEKKTSDSSSATSMQLKSPSQKLTAPSAKIPEKTEIDSGSKPETPAQSPVRPNSPMRDKVESQPGGDESEATKKKALLAKLNEKKRKLAEAKAQKEAQLGTVTEIKPDDYEKKAEFETAVQCSAELVIVESKDEEKPAEDAVKPETSSLEHLEPPVKKAHLQDVPKLEIKASVEKIEPVDKRAVEASIPDIAVEEKLVPSKSLTAMPIESLADETKKLPTQAFGGMFAAAKTGFGSGATSFGSSTFDTSAAGGALIFGSSLSVRPSSGPPASETASSTLPSEFSGIITTESSNSSVFLTNMKPPSSNAAPFSFGTSSGPIILPTPTNPQPITANPFGAFSGSPFGGVASQAMPLFGTSTTIKRSAPEVESADENVAKLSRIEEKNANECLEGENDVDEVDDEK